jgi:catechol 2,3-dioxygenase-like lactoylglutathione lyase family enzyme
MQLAHTMLRVRDLQASLDFYTDFLDLREVRRKVLGSEATLVRAHCPNHSRFRCRPANCD